MSIPEPRGCAASILMPYDRMGEQVFATSCLVVAILAATQDAHGGGPRVSISGHRAEVLREGGVVGLRVGITAKSTLPVAVLGLRVGMLFASSNEDMGRAQPAALYRAAVAATEPLQGEARVGVVVRRVALDLPAQGEAAASFFYPLRKGLPKPRIFRLHVLGYTLADASVPLLFELLNTAAAADEAASCEALALTSGPAEKAYARQRWKGRDHLVAGLAARAQADLPAKISQSEAFARVYAVRGLGVLGGESARAALRALLASPTLSRLDESFQVLRIARLRGSTIDTPLAFAVPAAGRDMKMLVEATLRELDELGRVTPRVPGSASADSTEPSAAPSRERGQKSSCSGPITLAQGSAVAVIAVLLVFILLRRRRRS